MPDEIYNSLREIKQTFGPKPNQNDMVDALIEACLIAGLNRRMRIVGALAAVGCGIKHVHVRLDQGAGTSLMANHWKRNDDGTYRLLSCETDGPVPVPASHIPVPVLAPRNPEDAF